MTVTFESMVFKIIKNPPTITAIQIFPKSCVMVNYPLIATVTTEYADGVDYLWFCERDDKEIIFLSNEAILIPSEACMGGKIKVFCTAWRWVSEEAVKSNGNDRNHDLSFPNDNIISDSNHDLNSLKMGERVRDGNILNEFGEIDRRSKSVCSSTINIETASTVEKQKKSVRGRMTGRAATCYVSGLIQPAADGSKIIEVRQTFNQLQREDPQFIDHSGLGMKGKGVEIRLIDELRVVSFNTLAEPFALSDYAVNQIYSYCPLEYLNTEYRMQLVVREILTYDADIICLQEVDMKTFQLYILPIMRDHGYDGHYTNKAGGVLEGCATITKNIKLKVLHRIDIPLKNVLRNAPILKGIYSIRPDLKDVLGGKLGTVGQITVCQCLWNPARVILLANTHLFYHPSAGFVRLLQTDVITRTMLDIRTYIETTGLEGLDQLICEGEDRNEGGDRCMDHLKKGEYKGGMPPDSDVKPPTVSVLFMGDFNSTSETAVIEYLDTGVISSEHEVWETINTFHWGQRSESETDTNDSSGSGGTTSTGVRVSSKVRSAGLNDAHGAVLATITPTLTHPFSLISASTTPYTNYTKGFKDILDYIYYQSDHLRVIRVAPFPSENILSQDVALPSQHFPSDHLAVVVDLMLI
mmetsp:Transcript_13747/g.13293  ORF Transcript_13747/g.13293 Transcript_13747/m.13293 type:complete len:639 (+) Transcript_13747:547-2463(+)